MVGGDTQQHVPTDDVRQITTSDYPYDIFRLVLVIVYIHIKCGKFTQFTILHIYKSELLNFVNYFFKI
jgi:hypothetical protein